MTEGKVFDRVSMTWLEPEEYARRRAMWEEAAFQRKANQGDLACPMVIRDTPGYRSPIDGAWVEGRRARRYDLEKNNCVDANELPSPTGGKLKNSRFAKKHGLEHLLKQS